MDSVGQEFKQDTVNRASLCFIVCKASAQKTQWLWVTQASSPTSLTVDAGWYLSWDY